MDVSTESLRRVVLVANRKGGVLKSSICRNVAAAAAGGGLRVAVLDGDPQGNVSRVDFGLDGDGGKSLAMALQFGSDLVAEHVDGVDVVSGGSALQGAVGAALAQGPEAQLGANLRASLGRFCDQGGYDLVLIDSGPGDTLLLDAYMATARWLVVPTNLDDASFDGVDMTGARYAGAVRDGAEIRLLGGVLTKVNPQATARNAAKRQELAESLGDAAPPFEAMIRASDAVSIDARRHAMSARDVAAEAVVKRKSRLAALRERARGEKVQGRDEEAWYSSGKDAGVGVAADYEALTREMLTRIAQGGGQ